ncbi:hypothetical protein GCM10020254_46250 [Streptomyces goshikiensis]
MAPHVAVDESGVDDGAEEGADVEEGGADDELQPEHSGGQDGDEGDDDQHDRAAADVVALFEGFGEGAEEDVGFAAGGGGDDLGDAVGGGDDGVEDEGVKAEARTVSQRKPMASDMAVVRGDAADGAFGDREEPEDEREDGARGEDDGVLLEEGGVGEVDVGGVGDGVAEFADDPGGGVGAALGEGGEGGLRAPVGSLDRPVPGAPLGAAASPFSQYSFAEPMRRLQSLLPLVADGLGEGVGAA